MNRKWIIGILLMMAMAIVFTGCKTEPTEEVMDDQMIENEMEEEMKDDMESEEMKDDMESDEMKDDMESEEMKDDKESDEMKDDMESDTMMDDMDTMMNEGPKAPAFSLLSVEGKQVKLEDFNKDKVMVKFWASWCSICLAGLDEIDELSGQMNDFKILTIVSPGHNGEKGTEAFIQWFETKGTENMVVLLDEGGEISKKYGIRGYPTTAFIGSDGVLVNQFPGHIDKANIVNLFEGIK